MNREIKFRVWCKENEQFIQFNKMGFLEYGSLWYVQGIDENEKEIDPPYFENRDGWELMQYTGLKDKNGVEIYEGDIINYERRGKEQVGIVEYYASACSFLLSDTHLLLSAGAFVPYFVGEVIGNIYENPELLEREAE